MTDEYDELFVEEEEPKEHIVSLLRPYVRFTEEGEFRYKEEYRGLIGREKVLVHLLSTKVLNARDLRTDDGMTAEELSEHTGIKRSTIEGYVYGSISELVDSDEGRIFVPNYAVHQVREEIGRDDNG